MSCGPIHYGRCHFEPTLSTQTVRLVERRNALRSPRALPQHNEDARGILLLKILGGYIRGVLPDPIPNSEVKPSRADGTAAEALWESRSPPDL